MATLRQLYRRTYRGLALPGAARGGSWSLAWSPLPLLLLLHSAHCHMWHKAGAAVTTPALPSWGCTTGLPQLDTLSATQETVSLDSESKLERLGF